MGAARLSRLDVAVHASRVPARAAHRGAAALTCARAYQELADLSLEGWLVEIRSGFAGGVLVLASHGDREIRETGPCVADVAGDIVRQARAWWRPDHAAPSPLPAGA